MMAGKAFGLFLVILAALTMGVEGKFNYSKGIAASQHKSNIITDLYEIFFRVKQSLECK